MKVLVAVSSCGDFERSGANDVMRSCWLRDCAAVGLDYKFFCGYGQDAKASDDTVLVDCDDGYGALTSKTQLSLRWAYHHSYDFVFRAFPDTYARPERLIECGFEASDFHGDFRMEHCGPDNYASGGPGYFLRRRAIEPLLDAPILGVWRDAITPYAEDLWIGKILARHYDRLGLIYFDDHARFINRGTRGNGPLAQNEVISTHLSCPDRYEPDRMLEKHSQWLSSKIL